MVEHLPYHTKAMGLILATASGTGREKMSKIIFRGSNAVVKHSPCHPKVMGFILATSSRTGREKIKK